MSKWMQKQQDLKTNELFTEGPVEVEGGADQREMGECLREVAQRLAAEPGLLGV